MHPSLFVVLGVALAGCASRPPVAEQTVPPRPLVSATPYKVVETRYDVRGYRDAGSALRHDAHAVYRRTRVPLSAQEDFATVPRSAVTPASLAPLPASEELAAELTKQREITARLIALQATLADLEQKMKAQYAALVQQSAETFAAREQLDTERGRLQNPPVSEVPASASVPANVATANPEVKW